MSHLRRTFHDILSASYPLHLPNIEPPNIWWQRFLDGHSRHRDVEGLRTAIPPLLCTLRLADQAHIQVSMRAIEVTAYDLFRVQSREDKNKDATTAATVLSTLYGASKEAADLNDTWAMTNRMMTPFLDLVDRFHAQPNYFHDSAWDTADLIVFLTKLHQRDQSQASTTKETLGSVIDHIRRGLPAKDVVLINKEHAYGFKMLSQKHATSSGPRH